MGVAVLQPHDCLKNSPSPKPIISPHSKMKLPNPTRKPSRSTRARPKQSHSTRPASTSDLNKDKLVMGQVKILKRGEQLTEAETVTERVGGLYAGSSMFVASPPPSSVPLPAFVTKKIAAVSDATSELRKMLRLDFS